MLEAKDIQPKENKDIFENTSKVPFIFWKDENKKGSF